MSKTDAFTKMQFRASLTPEGKVHFDFGDFNRSKIKQYVRENPNALMEISCVLPESRKQRGYFEGGLVPLFVFYNGGDYKNHYVIEDAREDLKKEFWSELRINYVTNKVEKKVKSTKGRAALNEMTEKVLAYLQENYAVPDRSVDPGSYKHWRDIELTNGAPENYIDYLLEVGVLVKR